MRALRTMDNAQASPLIGAHGYCMQELVTAAASSSSSSSSSFHRHAGYELFVWAVFIYGPASPSVIVTCIWKPCMTE